MKFLCIQLAVVVTQLVSVASLALAPRSDGKRGVALVSSGDVPILANSQCSWVYNWGETAPPGVPTNVQFIPMQWGSGGIETFASTILSSATPARTIFGFNEPDMAGQSNLAPPVAAMLWQTYMQPLKNHGIALGAPAVSSSPSGLTWLNSFMQACVGCTFDFIPLHWYGEGADNFMAYCQQAHSDYPNTPIWVTEFADTSSNPADVQTFLDTVLPWLDSQPWIGGYSWFALARSVSPLQTNLLDGSGNVNALGASYL
uniref:Asl1-like glycosyl hydrolase catalytic domain-containing protein n=1 Tax=Mycena chlorophos TaxID=658473 RepID=A0ABQ0L0Q6_MYCCL|nr:predicted protein [Mycena chlorophos]